MMLLFRSFRELVDPDPFYSFTSALISVAAVAGLLLDLGIYNFAEYVWIILLVGAALRWAFATRIRLVRTKVPWTDDAARLERRTVVVAALLFIGTCAATALVVSLSGLSLRFGLVETAATVAAIALGAGLFAWVRASILWRMDQLR